MTIDEAIRILDPKTRRKTLKEIPWDKRIDTDQEACEIAIAALRAQQNNGWISVKDQLPPEGEKVLVVASGKSSTNGSCKKEICIAERFKDSSGDLAWKIEEYFCWQIPQVDWWRPLPELPESERQ